VLSSEGEHRYTFTGRRSTPESSWLFLSVGLSESQEADTWNWDCVLYFRAKFCLCGIFCSVVLRVKVTQEGSADS